MTPYVINQVFVIVILPSQKDFGRTINLQVILVTEIITFATTQVDCMNKKMLLNFRHC